MTIKRSDHVSGGGVDLAAATAFFTAPRMTLEGEMPVGGPWVDRANGLESVQVDIVMMRTPDGHGRVELTKFRNPKLVEIEPAIAPPNAPGLRQICSPSRSSGLKISNQHGMPLNRPSDNYMSSGYEGLS